MIHSLPRPVAPATTPPDVDVIEKNVDAAAAKLETAGGTIVGVAADVRDFDEVTRALDSAAGRLGC